MSSTYSTYHFSVSKWCQNSSSLLLNASLLLENMKISQWKKIKIFKRVVLLLLVCEWRNNWKMYMITNLLSTIWNLYISNKITNEVQVHIQTKLKTEYIEHVTRKFKTTGWTFMKYKKQTSSLEELGTNKCLELFKIAKELKLYPKINELEI